MPNRTLPPVEKTEDDDLILPIQPTFKIFSGTLKAYEKADSRKYLSCTASSTVEDLHGDRMTAECVQDMAPQAKTKGLTIFLNHSYKVPEDVFGKTTDAKIVSRSADADGKAIYDLDLEIMLDESNERAVKTFESIKDQGMKLGVSIGAMIEDWEFIDEEAGWWGGLEIKAVNLLEASIVGIPANQRSWVVNGLNALGAPRNIIAKALGRGDPEDQPVAKPTVKAAEPIVLNAEALAHVEIKDAFFIDGVDVTDKLDVKRTITETPISADGVATLSNNTDTFKSLVVLDAEGNEIEDSTAPEGETPDEETKDEADTPDPTDTDKGLAPVVKTDPAETLKAAGISGDLLEIVLGILEGATDEVVSLRGQLAAMTSERDQAQKDLLEAAEIVETIAKTPLGRKAGFTGPVTTFRNRFGGVYDESLIRLIEGDETT